MIEIASIQCQRFCECAIWIEVWVGHWSASKWKRRD